MPDSPLLDTPLTDADPDARISVAIGLTRPIPLGSRVVAAVVEGATGFLARKGFELTAVGRQTIVVTGPVRLFEAVFQSRLGQRAIANAWNCSSRVERIVVKPAVWDRYDELKGLVSDITVERAHIYLAAPDPCVALPPRVPRPWATLGDPFDQVSAQPPPVHGFRCIDVLADVPKLLRAEKAHSDGFLGQGIRVAMIDTGFAHGHPFFAGNYQSKVCLAPLLDPANTEFDVDRKGHGTAQSANLFAIAPKVELIGIKLSHDQEVDDTPLLAPFLAALKHQPHIVSISLAYDLADEQSREPQTVLRSDLKPLEREIGHAVAAGIIVVAGSGNGHFGFPAQMREVIAVGGVYAEDDKLRASDFASAFKSAIYPGRDVPDCCGLVGEAPDGRYIVLPLPPGSSMDREFAAGSTGADRADSTKPDDGWAVFSGTSAATPQVAGVCALMLSANPNLKPADVLRILRATARPVGTGSASVLSVPPQGMAMKGKDATGAGLVDASAAVDQARAEIRPSGATPLGV